MTSELSDSRKMMLTFSVKLTNEPKNMEITDIKKLHKVGFSDRDIWDIANVAGFFNMTNRVASAVAMRPNEEYHEQSR